MIPALAAPLILGGASLAGSIFQGISSAQAASSQQDFQERMSNTAHQREVKDLRAAGLNPLLSANHGATSPPGAQPTIPDYGSSAKTAADAMALQSQLALNKAQVANIDAKTQTENATRAFLAHKMEADAAQSANQVFKSDAEVDSRVLKAYVGSLMSQYETAGNVARSSALQLSRESAESHMYDTKFGHYVLPWLSSAKEAAHTIVPFLPK